MKLSHACLLVLGCADAKKKRGNAMLDDLRYDWQVPRCISTPAVCTLNEQIESSAGRITLGGDDLPYANFANYLFAIRRPANEMIVLNFVAADGFEMEWHNQCGYDKLHIFTGGEHNFAEQNRIARFCGPKPGHRTPFDGAQKIKPTLDNVMPLWDTEYNTMSNEVLIAIDMDQGLC